jgi:hypothetical protein
MSALLKKEMRLSASILSYLFLGFSLMALLPGYPILCGAFFITLGLFQSFQSAREANDIVFSALLPVAKKDVVRGKYLFVCVIEAAALLLMAVCMLVRMTAFTDSQVYRANALMNANPVYLAFVLLIFTAFNVLFVGGFFKTGYKIGIPFLFYSIAAALLVIIAEVLPHLPNLAFLHNPAGERLGFQFGVLAAALVVYAVVTLLACRRAEQRFERIDL